MPSLQAVMKPASTARSTWRIHGSFEACLAVCANRSRTHAPQVALRALVPQKRHGEALEPNLGRRGQDDQPERSGENSGHPRREGQDQIARSDEMRRDEEVKVRCRSDGRVARSRSVSARRYRTDSAASRLFDGFVGGCGVVMSAARAVAEYENGRVVILGSHRAIPRDVRRAVAKGGRALRP
jgi:hypothetical protein